MTFPKLLLAAVLAAAFVAVAPGTAFACSCAGPFSDEEAIDQADAVFSGTVMGYEITRPIGGEYEPAKSDVRMALEVEWLLEADTIVKGEVEAEQIVVSAGQGPACGLQFDEGKRYLVFAYEERGELTTNSCSNTRSIDDDEPVRGAPPEVAAAGEIEGRPSGDSSSGETDSPWPTVMTIVLGFVALLLVGRRFVAPEEERP